MSKFLTVQAIVASAICVSFASKTTNGKTDETSQVANQQKVLGAYFSATGTTKAVAEEIAAAT